MIQDPTPTPKLKHSKGAYIEVFLQTTHGSRRRILCTITGTEDMQWWQLRKKLTKWAKNHLDELNTEVSEYKDPEGKEPEGPPEPEEI